MSFTSIEFFIFIPAVFILYWFVFQKNLTSQNLYLLVVSYLFYCCWDWRFSFLILLCSGVNYFAGIALAASDSLKRRKLILYLTCIASLTLLGFFKYFNFFVDNFISAFSLIGIHLEERSLNIILPVGISFYTFKALSYTIDVYRRNLAPSKDVIAFFSFISFFPQLLAGPIDRATSLLPQFYARRILDYDQAVDGMRQILWGLFKKVVVASTCAIYVDGIFNEYTTLPSSTLVLGSIFFAFQIYADFSGYSDIAIGTARLFGFNSMQNFSFPYFSRDIAEFWRRWHISLTSWFRDYLYIPLGGNRGNKYRIVRNTFIVFLVCGLWHGANWTFLIWGLINAVYFLPLLLSREKRTHKDPVAQGRILPGGKELLQMVTTFALSVFAWIFFRAADLNEAVSYIGHIFSRSLLSGPKDSGVEHIWPLLLVMVIVEWLQRDKKHGLEDLKMPLILRWAIYYVIIFSVLGFWGSGQQFIYFQF